MNLINMQERAGVRKFQEQAAAMIYEISTTHLLLTPTKTDLIRLDAIFVLHIHVR